MTWADPGYLRQEDEVEPEEIDISYLFSGLPMLEDED